MSRFRYLLIFFLVSFCFCGCSRNDFGEKHAHYELGVSLRIPDGWNRSEISSVETVTSMAFDDGKGAKIVLMLNYETSFSKQVDLVSEINYPILQKGPLLFSRYKAKWFLSEDNRTTDITYVIKDSHGRIFSLICTAPSINFPAYQTDFERVARSFRSF